ncbi:MAG: ABC transporter permease [Sedimentisphaerales bacterium]|nr:ABC transporter permease [Sedimentisphaerales bacterium]
MAVIIAYIGLALLALTYGLFAVGGDLDEENTHEFYVNIYTIIGILFVMVLPATSITSEKESKSWSLLLATDLTDWQIVMGKFFGSLYRCLPIWLILFAHLTVFSAFRIIHPVAIVQIAIIVTGVSVLLCGMGLYWSSLFKHSTTAVVMNFVVIAVFWLIGPLLMLLIFGIFDDRFSWYCVGHPLIQVTVVIDATVKPWGGEYNWEVFDDLHAFKSILFVSAYMLARCCTGLFFAWRAKCRIRRNRS